MASCIISPDIPGIWASLGLPSLFTIDAVSVVPPELGLDWPFYCVISSHVLLHSAPIAAGRVTS